MRNDVEKVKLEAALKEVISAIRRCEKIQPKFAEGTSQHSLLRNRIKALRVAKFLMERELHGESGSLSEWMQDQMSVNSICEELERVLIPLRSIQHKCQAGQKKHEANTRIYQQLQKQIEAMSLAEDLIQKECSVLNSASSVQKEEGFSE